MKFNGKKVALGAGISVLALWLIGRALLTVQLPDREGRRDFFPDLMDRDLSLRQVFTQLPEPNGQSRNEESAIRLLDENTQAWLERWRLLQNTGEQLDVCYFILKQDVFGASFLGHLVKKAQQGVRIRMLLDAMGTKVSLSFQGNDYLDTLVNAGNVTVHMYRPLWFRYLDAFLTLNPAAVFVSEHDKILLADGTNALIGGRNISANYFAHPMDDPLAFRDTDLLLSGARIGAAIHAAFNAGYGTGEAKEIDRESVNIKKSGEDLLLAYRAMDAWLQGEPIPEPVISSIAEKELPWVEQLEKMPHLRGALKQDAPQPILAQVRLLDSRSRLIAPDDPITRSLMRLVRSAREEIFIQSPYLVLPQKAVAILVDAAERGVRITAVTNSPLSSDNAMSQGVFLEQWAELLARVPTLRLYVASDRHNLHDKLVVFDRQLSLVGTYNLDPLSIAMNSELATAIWSERFADRILRPRRQAIDKGERLVEYRIARTLSGEPQRDDQGRIVVAFGPENHIDLSEKKAIMVYRRLFRLIANMLGTHPWY